MKVLKYRPEVGELRSVAVLSFIFFMIVTHAERLADEVLRLVLNRRIQQGKQ